MPFLMRSKSHHRSHPMEMQCKETKMKLIQTHNKENLEGRKTRDGKIDQVCERNRILRWNMKKKNNEVGK
jgi:hypothetical protein